MSSRIAMVIDGSFSNQLAIHVDENVDGHPLWTARFNATNPEAVERTHLDFLEAGADAILTNTYQANVEGYMKYLNLTEKQSIELIQNSVKLAQSARQKYLTDINKQISNKEKNILIIASIGPYGANLHDGSEYTGAYIDKVEHEIIKNWHRPRISAVIGAGVDALAIETIPCQAEAEIVVDLILNEYPNTKFWVSFQCKDELHLAHGEKFYESVLSIWKLIKSYTATENCLGIGVNCVHPKYVSLLFKSLNVNKNPSDIIPLVVYPNSGELYDVNTGWYGKEDCVPLETYVPEWIELGAKIVGGCCRTSAEDISRIKMQLIPLK